MLGRAFTEYAYLPASSTRGGILIAGRQADVSFSDVLDGQSKWWLTSVYGPQDDGDKAVFLEELEAIRDACAGPWAITGDFNLIPNEADKSNERIDRANLQQWPRWSYRTCTCTAGASPGATSAKDRRWSASTEC